MVLLQQSGCVNEQSVLKFQCTKYLHDSIEETEKGEENYTNNNNIQPIILIITSKTKKPSKG
jgi:hypothetical protein